MYHQIAPVEYLLKCLRARPLGREQECVAIPECDPDRVVRTGLALVRHRHLQGKVAAERDWSEWIRHVRQVRFRSEIGDPAPVLRRDPQRVDRRALDLIDMATLSEDDVDVALEALQVLVVDVETEVRLRAAVGLVCAPGDPDDPVAAASNETAVRLGDLDDG